MLFVIGSIQYEENIKKVAEYFREKEGFVVEYVKPEPNVELSTLILQVFKNIDKSDAVVAVKKPDGTYGYGTLYEIQFAIFIDKEVIEVSPDDITDPEWLEDRKKFY